MKKGDDQLQLPCEDDKMNDDTKLSSEVQPGISKNDDVQLLDRNNMIPQCLEEVKARNSENFQTSKSSTEGETSTHYQENGSENGDENPNMTLTSPGNFREHSAQADMFSFSLHDSSMQLLYMSVSWARNIPMFMNLPFRDQAILLEEAWSELFLLNAVYFFLPVDMTTLFSATNLHSYQSASSNVLKEIRTLQNVVARFHQLQMNAVEYACLKAVVLFKPGMQKCSC